MKLIIQKLYLQSLILIITFTSLNLSAQLAAVSPTASVTDGADSFDELDGADVITTVVIGNNTYALVTGNIDNGVQIMDISDPANPTATASRFQQLFL